MPREQIVIDNQSAGYTDIGVDQAANAAALDVDVERWCELQKLDADRAADVRQVHPALDAELIRLERMSRIIQGVAI
jgi:hypothetical protein